MLTPTLTTPPPSHAPKGSPNQAKTWLKTTGFTGELYIDDKTLGDMSDPTSTTPKSNPYKAFKLKRGVQVLRFDEAGDKVGLEFPDMKDIQEYDEKGEVVLYPGDVFQTGGVFILGAGNVCDYGFRSEYAGNHPDLNDVSTYATGIQSNGETIIYPSTSQWFDQMKNDKKVKVTFTGEIKALSANKAINLVLGVFDRFVTGIRVGIKGNAVQGIGMFGVGVGVLYKSFLSRKLNDRKTKLASLMYITGSGIGLAGLWFTGKKLYELAQPGPNIDYLDVNTDIILLTPHDIDEKVLQSGLPECDCGATMASMPMLGLKEDTDVVGAMSTTRKRSQTWTGGNSNEFQTILCYVREFLAKPHPAVGRGGPVCPFVPTSLKKNCLYFSIVRTSALLGDAIPSETSKLVKKLLAQLLTDFIAVFEGLEPKKGPVRQFKAVVLIFPDVKSAQAHEIIDEVQKQVKTQFVEKGLMVGEFHAGNNSSGLRNENFFPLRTPYPCLAIRYMVPGDIAFMTLDNYPVVMRKKLLKGFLDVFAEDKTLSDKNLEVVANAKRQLAELS